MHAAATCRGSPRHPREGAGCFEIPMLITYLKDLHQGDAAVQQGADGVHPVLPQDGCQHIIPLEVRVMRWRERRPVEVIAGGGGEGHVNDTSARHHSMEAHRSAADTPAGRGRGAGVGCASGCCIGAGEMVRWMWRKKLLTMTEPESRHFDAGP
jgi:hypothetical protein